MAYENFFVTKLGTAIGAADTTITLDLVPTVTSGYLVIDPKNSSTREIIRFTGVSGSTITGVTRGLSPTPASPHLSGAIVQMNVVAQDLEDALNVNSNVTNYFNDLFGDGVALTGTVWTLTSGLTGSMTTGYIYINGQRIQAPAIASKIFPALKDTYVDFDTNGNPVYTSVDVNAGEPALAADRVRGSKVTTSGSLITSIDNVAVRSRLVIPQSIDGDRDYTQIPVNPNTVTYNGNRSYDLTFVGTDLTGFVNPGTRIRTTRTVAAPTQSTSLNGTNQYWVKTSPNKLTFTDDFVVSAWVKVGAYASEVIASRFNNTSGWGLRLSTSGQVELIAFNASNSNFSRVTSYQSVPLNKWVHITAQLDMSAFTATTTTSYVMLDGVDVPSFVDRGGTNPTALIQAGNLEIGSWNGGTLPFTGKIAQVAIFNAKVTQATMRGYISQGLVGTETSLASAYSFNNSTNDLNATTPNNLVAGAGSPTATNADSPFGTQASGLIDGLLDYAIVQVATFSTNTTLTVQVPEGCTIPTSGGVSSVSYSGAYAPYGYRLVDNVLGYAEVRSAQSGTTIVPLNGLSTTFTPPIGRRLRITFEGSATLATSGNTLTSFIFDGATQLTSKSVFEAAAGGSANIANSWVGTLTNVPHTITVSLSSGANTWTTAASATTPVYLLVEALPNI